MFTHFNNGGGVLLLISSSQLIRRLGDSNEK